MHINDNDTVPRSAHILVHDSTVISDLAPLPFLLHRSDVDFVGEAPPPLSVQIPIRLRNFLRPELGVVVPILHNVLRRRDVDDAVDDGVDDVDTPRAELLREGGGHGAEAPFGSREGGRPRVGLDRGRRPGEDECRRVGILVWRGLSVLEKERDGGLREEEGALAMSL